MKLIEIISGYTKAIIFRELEKKSLMNLFKRFVSADIGEELLTNHEYQQYLDEKQTITVLFIDLNSFTFCAKQK